MQPEPAPALGSNQAKNRIRHQIRSRLKILAPGGSGHDSGVKAAGEFKIPWFWEEKGFFKSVCPALKIEMALALLKSDADNNAAFLCLNPASVSWRVTDSPGGKFFLMYKRDKL